MSKIDWEPDENGVPMCRYDCSLLRHYDPGDGDDIFSCTHPIMATLLYDLQTLPMMCYPQIAMIVVKGESQEVDIAPRAAALDITATPEE
jgi:hypothetical protein